VSHPDPDEKEFNEAEITFSEFEVKDEESFKKYVNGEDVIVKYYAD
jgi:hypothetical protein